MSGKDGESRTETHILEPEFLRIRRTDGWDGVRFGALGRSRLGCSELHPFCDGHGWCVRRQRIGRSRTSRENGRGVGESVEVVAPESVYLMGLGITLHLRTIISVFTITPEPDGAPWLQPVDARTEYHR